MKLIDRNVSQMFKPWTWQLPAIQIFHSIALLSHQICPYRHHIHFKRKGIAFCFLWFLCIRILIWTYVPYCSNLPCILCASWSAVNIWWCTYIFKKRTKTKAKALSSSKEKRIWCVQLWASFNPRNTQTEETHTIDNTCDCQGFCLFI